MTEVSIKQIAAQCKRLSEKQVRSFLRNAGLEAPPTGLPGMAPKHKYVFDLEDPVFQKVYRDLIDLDQNPRKPHLVRKMPTVLADEV